MPETVAEEIARLRREIGERQSRLQFLVCGDPRVGVHFGPNPQYSSCGGQGGKHYGFCQHAPAAL